MRLDSVLPILTDSTEETGIFSFFDVLLTLVASQIGQGFVRSGSGWRLEVNCTVMRRMSLKGRNRTQPLSRLIGVAGLIFFVGVHEGRTKLLLWAPKEPIFGSD